MHYLITIGFFFLNGRSQEAGNTIKEVSKGTDQILCSFATVKKFCKCDFWKKIVLALSFVIFGITFILSDYAFELAIVEFGCVKKIQSHSYQA